MSIVAQTCCQPVDEGALFATLAVPHSAMCVGEAWSHVASGVWWLCGNPGVELRYTV